MTPAPYALSAPGDDGRVDVAGEVADQRSHPAPGWPSPALASSAAKPAAVGDEAEVPWNAPPMVALSNPDGAVTSGLIRPSVVGPCDE